MEEGSSIIPTPAQGSRRSTWQHRSHQPKLTCPCPPLGDDKALALRLGVTNSGSFLGTVNREQASQVAVGWPALVVFPFHCSKALQGDEVWEQKQGI